tara:strand:- start:23 stop:199 length:177 start_codon:yes stop_codon:yes gene_type:complete
VIEESWDPKDKAAELLRRCNKTAAEWRTVYTTIGLPFQYKSPTIEQYMLAIQIKTKKD